MEAVCITRSMANDKVRTFSLGSNHEFYLFILLFQNKKYNKTKN
jgi:hypothetical protein